MIGLKTENRHEVLGLLLVALGLLIGLSLIPPHSIQGLFTEDVGSENLAGPVGEYLGNQLFFLLGWGCFLIPVLLILWGSNRFLAHPVSFPIKMTILFFGGSIIFMTASSIQSGEAPGSGWVVRSISPWFVANIGLFGSLLVLYSIGLILVVVTTGIRIGPLVSRFLSLFGIFVRIVGGWINQITIAVIEWKVERNKRRRLETERRVRERLGEKSTRPRKKQEVQAVDKMEMKVKKKSGITGKVQEVAPIPGEKEVREPIEKEGAYSFPPLSLLQSPEDEVVGRTEKENEELAQVLIEKLADFNIRGEVIHIVSGPVITMFELKPAPGVKVSQIQNLSDDLAMAMRAQRIRIVAPIPGKGAVGIEVPNYKPETVLLREIIGSEDFERNGLVIPLPLGKNTVGKSVAADLAGMPHLLIAGATGSGKSVNIHCIVTGFLYCFSPDVELGVYKGIPHLLVPVVTDAKEAVRTLKWAVREMEERYGLLASLGVRGIPEYNRRVASEKKEGQRRLPYLVIIIDELADLILTMQNEVEEPLARLAQMARGVGIHLILATQRPSVDVITGMIKANFPSRISFQVASKTDSRTILDTNGAEKLLGKGDMLFMPGGSSNPIRIHGAFISHTELERVVNFVRKQVDIWAGDEVTATVTGLDQMDEEVWIDDEERDKLFNEAIKLVIRYGHGSTSLLQRRLKIGYTRAARIVDQLEAASIVGPPDGSKAREVMVDESYLDEKGII
jgi:S-DNA-T family DNA segregation ATPase FtsK/SpoIIIE